MLKTLSIREALCILWRHAILLNCMSDSMLNKDALWKTGQKGKNEKNETEKEGEFNKRKSLKINVVFQKFGDLIFIFIYFIISFCFFCFF